MNLQQVPPFCERHEFTGQFILDDTKTDSVEAVVEYNKLDSGPITGVVRNRGSAMDVARQVYESRRPCRLVSVTDEQPEIEIGEVFVSGLSLDRSQRAPDVAAELSCGTVSETWRRTASTQREMTFRLAGRLGILEPRETSTTKWTGERDIERANSKLDLGVPWPGAIELRNEYLWEQDETVRRGRYASVPTLCFECDATKGELSDEQVIEDTKVLANDVTLLMSFALRHWISWYYYTFSTPRFVCRHRIVSSRDVGNRSDRMWDSPVGLKSPEILRVCLPRYQKHRENGRDLRLPITHSIPEAGRRYVEERFARAFWGLEKLVAVLAERNEPGTAATRRGEALSAKLQRLCDSLGVTWRDLYPANDKRKTPKFIETRNKVFHSHRSVNSDLVWRETRRVSLLFERLVLRTLGWSELDHTTPEASGLEIDKKV